MVLTPAPRSNWAASLCSSCHPSTRRWNGRPAVRPLRMVQWKCGRWPPRWSNALLLKTRTDDSAHRAVEAVARESYGRLVALLAARTHDVASAEDALADALV